MSFIEDVKANFYQDKQALSPGYRAFLFADGVYIEGVVTMLCYTEDKVDFSLKAGKLSVTGEKLYVKKYCGGDVVITGKILGVSREC